MPLPRLKNIIEQDNVQNDTSTVLSTESENVEQDRQFILNLIEEKSQKLESGNINELRAIDYEVLSKAPADFFDKYIPLVDELLSFLQDKITTTNQAYIIANIKKDPTNEVYKDQAFRSINRIYTEWETQNVNLEFNKLTSTERKIIFILASNNLIGLGPLEPFLHDHRVREIMCNGPFDINVEVGGQVQRVPSCKFQSKQELQDLISKLYNSVNREITRNTPVDRARLTDNSRVFAVHESVAPDGPNLNIRRHTDDWVGPKRLLELDMYSKELIEWLGNCIHNGLNIVISGGTSTGKTTLLGALSGFYANNQRIVTVERNIELKLAPDKLKAAPMEVVKAKAGSSAMGVSMSDLVEATTQMRPEIIIVGESTGPEAYDLLTALNTGHSGATTIHTNSAEDSINRLVTLTSMSNLVKGKAVLELISSAFDIIVYITRFPEDGSRKITAIHEVGTEITQNKAGLPALETYPIWEYEVNKTAQALGKITGEWIKVGELSETRQRKHNINLDNNLSYNELMKIAGEIQ